MMALYNSSHLSIISPNAPAKIPTFNNLNIRSRTLILYPHRHNHYLPPIFTLRANPPQKYIYPDPIPEFAEAVNSPLLFVPTSISYIFMHCYLPPFFFWFLFMGIAGNPEIQNWIKEEVIGRWRCFWWWTWSCYRYLRKGDYCFNFW